MVVAFSGPLGAQQESIEVLRTQAEAGNAIAQYSLGAAISQTAARIHAQNHDTYLAFRGWSRHWMREGISEEQEVMLWLTRDNQLVLTEPEVLALDDPRRRSSNEWDRYEHVLAIDMKDIYGYDYPYTRDGNKELKVIRIFYREGGTRRYVLIEGPDLNRRDDFRWAVFTGELITRTGLTAGNVLLEDTVQPR